MQIVIWCILHPQIATNIHTCLLKNTCTHICYNADFDKLNKASESCHTHPSLLLHQHQLVLLFPVTCSLTVNWRRCASPFPAERRLLHSYKNNDAKKRKPQRRTGRDWVCKVLFGHLNFSQSRTEPIFPRITIKLSLRSSTTETYKLCYLSSSFE